MHQKSLYLKLGKRRHKLNVYAGFNHQAIWGGEDKIFTGGLKRAEAYEYVVLGKPWLSGAEWEITWAPLTSPQSGKAVNGYSFYTGKVYTKTARLLICLMLPMA
jgi:hypothetical protein